MKAFKLGTMTLGSLFKQSETIQYPAQTRTVPEGRKGHIVMDSSKCILCGMCARKCPAHAISVDREARTWTIDYLRCVQCASCTRECPKDCLTLDPELPHAVTADEPLTVTIGK